MTGKYETKKYKGNEAAYVETVKVLGHEHGTSKINRVALTYRIPVSMFWR